MKIFIALSRVAVVSEGRCTFVSVNTLLAHFHKPRVELDRCPTTGQDVRNLLIGAGLKLVPMVQMRPPIYERVCPYARFLT